jgi:coenzyme F420-reducing hydrogenase beta subunit
VDYDFSFRFTGLTKHYSPVLIEQFSEYNICASIYHEMDMQKFYRKTFCESNRGKSIVVTTLPCQTPLVRSLAKKYGISVIVIGLTCSSQQSFEATQYLMKRKSISIDNLKKIQYRGNGWPSGVQLTQKDNTIVSVPNRGSIWTTIFHSRLFIPTRCFKCQDTLNSKSDVILADPWLKDQILTETIGKTLFASYTMLGENLLNKAISKGYIEAQAISSSLLYQSQESTILRKEGYKRFHRYRNVLIKICKNKVYKYLVLKSPILFHMHITLKDKIESKMR